MQNLNENIKIMNEVFAITSAAGATSRFYSMHDCDIITFAVGYGTANCAATAITATFNVRQSGDKNGATNAAITGATGTIGPTTANSISGAKSVLINVSSASTLTDVIIVNGSTLTYSTLPAATSLNFGTTVGTTGASGVANIINSLATLINDNVTVLPGISAATVGASAVLLSADDTAATSLAVATTGTNFTLQSQRLQSLVSVRAGDLNSTSQYVGLQITTAVTSVPVSITVLKGINRYNPPFQVAQTNVISS